MLLTIIIDNRDFVYGFLPDDGIFVAFIAGVDRNLHEEHLIWLPFIIINDLDVDMFEGLVPLKHHGLLHRNVVSVRLGCAVYRLNPTQQGILPFKG